MQEQQLSKQNDEENFVIKVPFKEITIEKIEER